MSVFFLWSQGLHSEVNGCQRTQAVPYVQVAEGQEAPTHFDHCDFLCHSHLPEKQKYPLVSLLEYA